LEKGQEIYFRISYWQQIACRTSPGEERSDERALAVKTNIEEKEREEGVGGWLVCYWAGDAYYPPRWGGALLAGWAEIGLAGLRLFFFPIFFFEFN
jgi:hypothetical protein